MITVNGTGVYVAYPRSEDLVRVDGGPESGVNCRHTKVGIATESFGASASKHRQTFHNRMKFMPLAEVPAQRLPEVEQKILSLLATRYRQLGNAANWFDTQDRNAVIGLIYALFSPSAVETP